MCMSMINHAQSKIKNTQDQSVAEKRIAFNKGVIKICTSSKMAISGYNGDEVIIRQLNSGNHTVLRNILGSAKLKGGKNQDGFLVKGNKSSYKASKELYGQAIATVQSYRDRARLEEGLRPLGNKSTDPADNLYLDIEEKNGELIIKDYKPTNLEASQIFFRPNTDYELLIPNTTKLLFNVENCQKQKTNQGAFVINSSIDPWTLSNFKGEAEISTYYKNVSLTDVTGPVLVNTIGGNINVVFDKETPKKLYSLISNDGYINVELPESADISVSAIGNKILSNIDFKVLNETIINGTKGMDLQLNSGKTKMKLDASSGSVYLRKKE